MVFLLRHKQEPAHFKALSAVATSLTSHLTNNCGKKNSYRGSTKIGNRYKMDIEKTDNMSKKKSTRKSKHNVNRNILSSMVYQVNISSIMIFV